MGLLFEVIWLALLVFGLVEGFTRVDGAFLATTLLVTAGAEAGEHYVRAWGAKCFGAGCAGAWGAVIGAPAGLFFLPLGLVLGPFLGALLAELLTGRNLPQAARAGWGGLVGTLGFLPVKLVLAIGITVAFVLRATSMSFIEAARRAQIVAAAIDVLAEAGHSQCSLARIAERARISKSVISYHFAGKDELMQQIVTEVYTRGAHLMLPRTQAESRAPAMLRALITANVEFIARNRKALIAATEVISNLRKPDGSLYYGPDADEVNLKGVEWVLRKGQEEGDFRAFDVWVMALTIRACHRPIGVPVHHEP